MIINGKKMIMIFLFTIVLSLTLSRVVWGEITVTGVVNLKYDFAYNKDFLDGTISFNGKINDNANAYAAIVLQNQRDRLSAENYEISKSVFCFVYNFKPNPGYLLVGCFNNNIAGDLVALSSAVNEQRSYFGVKFEYPFSPNFSMKVGAFPNEQNHSIANQLASTIGASYYNNNFKADANIVKFSNTVPLYYTANFRYKPGNLIATYGQYGCGYKTDGSQNLEAILGLMLSLPPAGLPLTINFEYNFLYDDNTVDVLNHYGYRILYEIDKNISLSYFRTVSANNYNEIRLRIVW